MTVIIDSPGPMPGNTNKTIAGLIGVDVLLRRLVLLGITEVK